MKNFFQIVGIISLLCFSFIYTEKTVTVVKEFDDIMIQIKEQNELYKILPTEATIADDTIIPGLNGSEIDIDKSYSKMKRYGKYNMAGHYDPYQCAFYRSRGLCMEEKETHVVLFRQHG